MTSLRWVTAVLVLLFAVWWWNTTFRPYESPAPLTADQKAEGDKVKPELGSSLVVGKRGAWWTMKQGKKWCLGEIKP